MVDCDNQRMVVVAVEINAIVEGWVVVVALAGCPGFVLDPLMT